MSSALSTAVSGINNAVSRATQAAGDIVKASSTGKNLDKSLVDVKQASVDVSANAAVIRSVNKENKALLDIMA